MEFDGNLGLWQRKISEGLEGTARRMKVMRALAIKSGQSFLDLGCGGGHLVREIALAVGDDGRSVGLDASAEQIDTAREYCSDLAAAELMQGDATNLSFDNGSFDGVASIQMLEYITDVDSALQEARRVLKPGARAALVSVLWDHWRFHGAEPDLNNQMHEVWRAHCPHQMLPFEMEVKLKAVGFCGVVREPIAFINDNMHDNAFARWASKLVAAFAASHGVAKGDVDLWLEQLGQADREGRFGFVSVPVLTTAVAD